MIAPIHFDLTPLGLLQATRDRKLVASAIFLPPIHGRESALAIVMLDNPSLDRLKPAIIQAAAMLPAQDPHRSILIDVHERVFTILDRMQQLELRHTCSLITTHELGQSAATFIIGDTATQWLVPTLNHLNCPVSLP